MFRTCIPLIISSLWIVSVILSSIGTRILTRVLYLITFSISMSIPPALSWRSRVGAKLITALRTAVENGEGVLDKEATSFDDLFDSFRTVVNVLALVRLVKCYTKAFSKNNNYSLPWRKSQNEFAVLASIN